MIHHAPKYKMPHHRTSTNSNCTAHYQLICPVLSILILTTYIIYVFLSFYAWCWTSFIVRVLLFFILPPSRSSSLLLPRLTNTPSKVKLRFNFTVSMYPHSYCPVKAMVPHFFSCICSCGMWPITDHHLLSLLSCYRLYLFWIIYRWTNEPYCFLKVTLCY